jgi:S-(hydroxymethyl)glutathione dehydrogenase/alcohol dehydrogenase
VKLPDDAPLDKCALLGCAVTTGVGAVFNTAQVAPGEQRRGVRRRRRRPERDPGRGHRGRRADRRRRRAAAKLEMARTFGATDVVDATQGRSREAIRR